MTFFDFLTGLGAVKFFFLCLFAAIASVSIVLIILKIVKELSVKIGNVAISLKGEEQKKDIVNLVFDYGAFQDQINDTRDLAVATLHKQAKRYTKLQLIQYLQRLRGEYAKVLEPTGSDSNQITNVIFNMFTNELKGSMFSYMIEIYERNHLSGKTDAELKAMAHDHYEKLADMFKDHAASIWIPVMQPYAQVRDISVDISTFVEGLVYDILAYYRELSETKLSVYDAVRKICAGVKCAVNDKLRLPENADYIAERFFTEAGGLDKDLIAEFLNGKQI